MDKLNRLKLQNMYNRKEKICLNAHIHILRYFSLQN